ncbi:MAG TPA: type II secretion system protein, partial [Candidatus Limnocylindria bacterium]|nr:type II secretion system protein [Candidatus Limnocylindria bacterium]
LIATNLEKSYGGGQLWPYLKLSKVFLCPTDVTNKNQNKYYASRPNKLSTYIWNGSVNGFGALGAGSYKQSAFNPEAYYMWEPDEANYVAQYGFNNGYNCYNDASSGLSQGEGLGRRHGKKGGIMAGFSGHVVAVTYEQYNKERLRMPGLLHCVPGSPTGD